MILGNLAIDRLDLEIRYTRGCILEKNVNGEAITLRGLALLMKNGNRTTLTATTVTLD